MTRVLYPVASFLVIPLVCASLGSHIRSRNIAVISLIFWVALLCLIRGVNAIVWDGNTDIRLLVWCDITTKIAVAWTLAVPLTMLCLVMHLERIAANRQITITERDKRRRMIFEGVMCYVIPVVFMAIHYCVQGHRLDIYEHLGCYPNTYASVPAFILIDLPPFLVSVACMGYAVMSVVHLFRRRTTFTSLLQSSNNFASQSHYVRLMALGIFECLWDTGLNAWVLYLNVKVGFRPWISWGNVHSDFSRVQPYSWAVIPEELIRILIIQWWITPISALVVFFFFTFGSEAKADYFAAWYFMKTKVLRIPDTKRQSLVDLPMYIDAPLSVTKLSEYMDEKESRSPKVVEAPWEKIKLKIPESPSFSSSNDGFVIPPLQSTTSSTSLVETEKRVMLFPVAEPAPIHHPSSKRPAAIPIVTLAHSRDPTPELRVTGPFEADPPRSSVDSSVHRTSGSFSNV